jgi:hypothetical protein
VRVETLVAQEGRGITVRSEGSPPREGEAEQTVVGASTKTKLDSHGVLAPNRARLRGALTLLWVGATTRQVTGEQIRDGMSVDLMNQNAVHIRLEIASDGESGVVNVLNQGQVHHHDDQGYLRILTQDGYDFSQDA